MAKIIDGKAVSQSVKDRVKAEVEKLRENGIEVGLAVVIVGIVVLAIFMMRSDKKQNNSGNKRK